MRSVLMLILFLALAQQHVFARLEAKDGYYVTLGNDTVRGMIKIRTDYLEEPYYFRIQYGAFYVDSLENIYPLRPGEIKSFTFFHKYEYITFVSVEYFENYQLFLRVLNAEGGVRLYVHYKNVVDTRTDFGSLAYYLLEYPASSEEDCFFLTKPDGSSVKYNKYSGKKNIVRFFSDYPELQTKIERGLYGYTAIYKIVREYNQWFSENNHPADHPIPENN